MHKRLRGIPDIKRIIIFNSREARISHGKPYITFA